MSTHQVPVPTQQGLGLDKESATSGTGEQSTQPSQQGTISWSKRRPVYLSTQDRHLVTEDDDLDGQIGGGAPLQAQQLEDPEEGEIKEGQGHHPQSWLKRPSRNLPVQDTWMTFSAPTPSLHRP